MFGIDRRVVTICDWSGVGSRAGEDGGEEKSPASEGGRYNRKAASSPSPAGLRINRRTPK
jgi:hypothetical protein